MLALGRSTAAFVLALGLAGCAGSAPTPSAYVTTPSPPPEPTASAPTTTEPSADPSGDPVSETPIRIVVADQVIEGRLWDNPAALSLLDQLPVTLDFSDYGRQEVTAVPPQPLTMDGMPSGESAPSGTIGYYAPGGVVVLYYTDVGRFSGIVRIGQMDGDYSILRGWSDARPVTIELAD